jgi:hypothetical protein
MIALAGLPPNDRDCASIGLCRVQQDDLGAYTALDGARRRDGWRSRPSRLADLSRVSPCRLMVDIRFASRVLPREPPVRYVLPR